MSALSGPRPAARVVALIACLDPPAELVDATRETLRQVDAVIAVDDGSGDPTTVFADLEALGVTVVHQPNVGIAGALNAGITRVLDDTAGEGAAYVLTLDQDSGLEPGYVAAALAAAARLDAAGAPWGFVSAESYSGRAAPIDGLVELDSESTRSTPRGARVNLVDSESSDSDSRDSDSRDSEAWGSESPQLPALRRAFDPMQSGWLVPLSTFARVGLLEDDLVIDGVDSEFTARCRAAGLPPVVAPGSRLVHGQGEREPGRLLGRRIGMVNRHSPIRVYYMARNGTLITRRYLVAQPRWVLRRLREEATAHALRLLLDPARGRLALALFLGWRDGLLGRTGRVPGPTERRLGRGARAT